MTCGDVDEPTPADALALMITGYDLLVKGLDASGADGFDAGAAVGFMQAFERFRNGLPVVDNHLIAVAERLDLPTVLCQGNLARVLTSGLGISKVEASRRVRAAEVDPHRRPRRDVHGRVRVQGHLAEEVVVGAAARPEGDRAVRVQLQDLRCGVPGLVALLARDRVDRADPPVGVVGGDVQLTVGDTEQVVLVAARADRARAQLLQVARP